jgi:hypothetical protein
MALVVLIVMISGSVSSGEFIEIEHRVINIKMS